MRQVIQWTAAAAVAAGGMAMLPPRLVADEPIRNPAPTDVRQPMTEREAARPDFTLPPGVKPTEVTSQRGIDKAFARLTNSAMRRNGYIAFTDQIDELERDRLQRDYKERNNDELNVVVQKLDAEWQDKYHSTFDLDRSERAKVFGGVAILEGKIADPKQVATMWPLPQPVMAAEAGENARPAAERMEAKEIRKLEKGRQVAFADFPPMMDLPPVRCTLIDDHLVGWKFVVPTTLSGRQLHDNLVRQLRIVADHPDRWPADADDAYRLVSHRVLMAVYDVQSPANEFR
jgi:hypothetical protein